MTANPPPFTTTLAVSARPDRKSPLHRLLRDPVAVICLVYLLLIILAGALAPWIVGSPTVTRLELVAAPPFGGEYILGGDSSGRDIFARLVWATRGTLLGSLEVVVVSVAVGVTAGLIAGYFRGRFEKVSDWVSDVIIALPGIVLLIALYSLTGPNVPAAMAVFGIIVAPTYFRIVRGIVVAMRRDLFVDAARVAGLSSPQIIARHVIWAVRPAVIIQSAFVLSAGIGVQAALEFLGLGDPSTPSWGGMLQESFANIYNNGTAVIWPVAAITITTLAFVLLGNSLRDVLQVGAGRVRVKARRRNKPLPSPAAVTLDESAILQIQGLRIGYPASGNTVTEVVKGVNLAVHAGEIRALVGESGSGKSQTAFATLGILPRTAQILAGSVLLGGNDLLRDRDAMKKARGRRISYIPQEPMTNLDPTFTVGAQLVLGIRATSRVSRREAKAEVLRLFDRVGIRDPERVFGMYPFEISGGMAQRVLITGAIATNPDILIADEPTTALDVTVQADVLELLREIRDERGLGVLLVTHNLGVVADICDSVSVMKDGEIVEEGSTLDIFQNPQHPYTRELLDAVLDIQKVES
jgi:peptide/nickel transport system permease protein